MKSYVSRQRSDYNPKRFGKICKCVPQCESAVDILDPLLQEVLFTLCHKKAKRYAYGLLKITGELKSTPESEDGRTKTDWTDEQKLELIELVESGKKGYGSYVAFGVRHGKTRISVKAQVRHLRKLGKIKERVVDG